MVAGRSGLYCRKCEKSHSLPNLTKIGLRLMKAQVWLVATYGCESWTLRKNEESGAENSCLAFSTLAFWCRIFMSRNFMSRIFSVPEEARLDAFEMKGLRRILRVSWTAKKTNEWVLNKAAVKGTVRYSQSKEASILWSHREETRELPGERDNARNNARCTKARKATHGLDGQHQDVDRTLRGRVSQKNIGQR